LNRPNYHREQIGRALVQASRWSLVLSLLFAVWAYGAVRHWTIQAVGWWMLGTFVIWGAGWLCRAERPGVSRWLLGLIGGLLLYGWFLTLNARGWYEAGTGVFRVLQPWVPGWPGSVDVGLSTAAMFRISGLLLLVPVASDLARNPIWRQRFWDVLAANAATWALFGMIQKSLGAPSIFWESTRVPAKFFGTYGYHGNATSFLLIGLGLTLARAAWAWRQREDRPFEKAAWTLAPLLILGALFMNTSRAGQMLALIGVLGGIVLLRTRPGRRRRDGSQAGGTNRWLLPVTGVICLAALLFSIDWSATRERWSSTWTAYELHGEPMDWGRIKSAEVTARAIALQPWFGYGPGTFRAVFPVFRQESDEIPGLWKYAHHDYLQTAMEWGIIGLLGWATLFAFGLGRVRPRLGERARASGEEAERLACWRAALWLACGLVLLHAAGDFPLQILSIQMGMMILIGMAWGTPLGGAPVRRTHSRHRQDGKSERADAGAVPTGMASLLVACGMVLSGCTTPPEPEQRGDFRFQEVPEEKASYTVVVESLSGVVNVEDYDAMEQLVVRQFNQAGLPAVRMFESDETTHYLYVFLQKTDEVTEEATPQPAEPTEQTPQRWAASNPRYLRGSGLQTPSMLLARHGRRDESAAQPDAGEALAGKLAVLFAVFQREELDSLIMDNPNPEPQVDGMFFADLQGELLTAGELREITAITAQRILEAQSDPAAAIAATAERQAADREQLEQLRPDPFEEIAEEPAPLPALDDDVPLDEPLPEPENLFLDDRTPPTAAAIPVEEALPAGS